MALQKTKNTKAGKQKEDASSVVTQIASPLLVENQEYIPEPPLLDKKLKIYQPRILILLTIASEMHAYMGLLPDPNVDDKKSKSFFPFIIIQSL